MSKTLMLIVNVIIYAILIIGGHLFRDEIIMPYNVPSKIGGIIVVWVIPVAIYCWMCLSQGLWS